MVDIYEGLKTEDEREAAYEKFVWQNLKRNYTGHFLHGMLGMTGFRLFNAPTFIPAYLHVLSGSDVIVGLGLGLQQFGGVVSPIVGATLIEYRKHVLSLSMWLGTMMRIPILAIALAGWFLDGTALLATVMFFLFVLGLFSGPQGVAFQFLLAKMIPISWRGRLQGLRNVTGGLIAAVLSYFAGEYLVGGNFLGNGYSATFMVAFVLTSMGLTAFGFLVREPEPPSVRPRMRVRDRVRD
ncbi:MAG: MFS transporter, partial [Alphaproteobacteria bacterium]|nr:MFS transporter [Alphaproteobacteria bacterium]